MVRVVDHVVLELSEFLDVVVRNGVAFDANFLDKITQLTIGTLVQVLEQTVRELRVLSHTSISNVDDATSTQIRLVVTPNSNDIVPVRNQILELDLTNTTITATADTEASSGSTFSTSGSGSTATTTVSTSGGGSSY